MLRGYCRVIFAARQRFASIGPLGVCKRKRTQTNTKRRQMQISGSLKRNQNHKREQTRTNAKSENYTGFAKTWFPTSSGGFGRCSPVRSRANHSPAKSKRGREEGDGTENVISCRKSSQIVVTFMTNLMTNFMTFYVTGSKRKKLS